MASDIFSNFLVHFELPEEMSITQISRVEHQEEMSITQMSITQIRRNEHSAVLWKTTWTNKAANYNSTFALSNSYLSSSSFYLDFIVYMFEVTTSNMFPETPKVNDSMIGKP